MPLRTRLVRLGERTERAAPAAPVAGWQRAVVTTGSSRGRDSFRAEHFDGERFFNPTGANGQPVRMELVTTIRRVVAAPPAG